MAAAMLCFTTLDTIMRALYAEHPLPMLVFVRNLVQVAALALLVPVIGPGFTRTRRVGIHILRGICLVLTTVFITLALGNLPMAQTYSITFSTPLMATVLAAVALGERPSTAQWVCIFIGLVGVVIVLDPQDFVFGPALLYPLAMAFFNAVLYVLTRYAGQQEGPLTLVFWASLAALAICLAGLPFYAVPIPLTACALLAVGGVAGTAAHLMITGACRLAPMAVVSPILYSQIVWAGLIGWLVFEEVPAAHVMMGSALIIACGIVTLRSRTT
ncbi:DMT family transporter [Ancylobacter oerskovii]|nr:DMT family transporter [Ancylobacter oerskovii]